MTGQIKHVVPSQRRQFRVNAPIKVVIEGTPYDTINWSIIDFKVADYQGNLVEGDQLDITLVVPYQGFEVSFTVPAKVMVRDNEAGTLAGEFYDVGPRRREILESFVAGLVRGEMDSIDGMIRRMDVPVTPASLKPDTPLTPEDIERQERRRSIGAAMYVAAGVVFTIAVLMVFYTNFFQVKVRTAAMAAPTDIILAPATGNVKAEHTAEREVVDKDTLLISFIDPELEQDIELAGLRLEEALSNTAVGGDASRNETEEMKSARATVQSRRSALNVVSNTLKRQRDMMRRGLTTRLEMERAEADYYEAQSRYNDALQKLNGMSGRTTSLSYAEGEYSLLRQQRERLDIKAPAAGQIVSYLAPEGASVRYGDPVAIFQHNEPRYVEAYLTREEALSVAVGDEAKVHFPSHNETMRYVVEDVDYASQLISKKDGRVTLDQVGLSRDVLIRMTPRADEDEEIINRIVPGSAAVVVFNKPLFGR